MVTHLSGPCSSENVFRLGYGGLSAPERPVPVFCPGNGIPTPSAPWIALETDQMHA